MGGWRFNKKISKKRQNTNILSMSYTVCVIIINTIIIFWEDQTQIKIFFVFGSNLLKALKW